MAHYKIADLPQAKLSSDIIDNCLFVENLNTNKMRGVPISQIFDEIIERAKKADLEVTLTENGIKLHWSK